MVWGTGTWVAAGVLFFLQCERFRATGMDDAELAVQVEKLRLRRVKAAAAAEPTHTPFSANDGATQLDGEAPAAKARTANPPNPVSALAAAEQEASTRDADQ